MSKITKKLEEELKVVSYVGRFDCEGSFKEYLKDIKKYKVDGWESNLLNVEEDEDTGLTEIRVMLKRGRHNGDN